MNDFGNSNANSEKRRDLKSIQEELNKIFHENRLDALSNANDLGFSSSNSNVEEGYEHNISQFATPLNSRLFQTHNLSLFSPGGLEAMSFSPLKNQSPFFVPQSIIHPMKDQKEGKESTSGIILPAQRENKVQTSTLELEKVHLQDQRDTNINEVELSNDICSEDEGLVGGFSDTPLSSMWMDSNTKASLNMRNDEKVNREKIFYNKREDSLLSQSMNYHSMPQNQAELIQNSVHQTLFVRPKKFGRKLEDEYEAEQADFEPKKQSNPQISAPIQSLNILKQHPKRADDGEERDARAMGTFSKDLGPLFLKASEGASDFSKSDLESVQNRNSRGLRVLTLKVKEIVTIKKEISYKKVAEALSNEIGSQLNFESGKAIVKDEQNIKRRVYDALNVLIAANVLKKKGKNVCCIEDLPAAGIQAQKQLKDQKLALQNRINTSQARVIKKKETLQRYLLQYIAVKSLVEKNKSEIESNSKRGIKSKINHDRISFPFIVLENKSKPLNLNMSKDMRELKVSSSSEINIYGDIDVLFYLNLHRVSREFLEHNTDPSLQRYLPENYFTGFKNQ